jgi:hypothetical protein
VWSQRPRSFSSEGQKPKRQSDFARILQADASRNLIQQVRHNLKK